MHVARYTHLFSYWIMWWVALSRTRTILVRFRDPDTTVVVVMYAMSNLSSWAIIMIITNGNGKIRD